MKTNKILGIIIVLIIVKFGLDLAFKIKYHQNAINEINNFIINDSLIVPKGKFIVGKNIKGQLEAIILPDSILKLNDSSTIEYIYLRFYPEWFQNNIKPRLGQKVTSQTEELIKHSKNIHNDNFEDYMHINEYPLIRKDFLPYVIKIKESNKKIRLEYKK